MLGEAGVAHRKVEVFDAEVGERLGPGLAKARLAGRLRRGHGRPREPDRESEPSAADEVGPRSSSPSGPRASAASHIDDEDGSGSSPTASGCSSSTMTRFFAARVDGEIGGYCELYSDRRHRPDRERPHARAVPEPRPRAGAGPARLEASRQRATTSPSCSPTATTGRRSSTASSASTRSARSTASSFVLPQGVDRVRHVQFWTRRRAESWSVEEEWATATRGMR